MLRRPLLFAGAAAVGFGACSARALSLSGQTDLSFKARFRGQLGPPRPTAAALAAGATDTGPLSVEDGVVYQGGAFSSLWIRVGCEPDLVSASALDVLVGAALAKQCTLPKPGAVCHEGLESRISRPQAEHQTSRPHPTLLLTRLRLAGQVYVALSETSVDAAHVRCLLAKGFRFYHHRTSPEGDDELVYYAWPDRPDYPDKVPPYATSTEGVGAILLSPDEVRHSRREPSTSRQQGPRQNPRLAGRDPGRSCSAAHTREPRLGQTRVLLVWEYGCWKMPTGAVDAGEGALSALRREVGEEVGCEVHAHYVQP